MFRLTSKVTTNPINQSGLIAGAMGGESVVLVVLVNTLILRSFAQSNLPASDPKVIAWNTLYPFLIIAIFEGWGVFAGWLSLSKLTGPNDALLAGFITGVMIGILLEVMWIAQLLSMIAHQFGQYAGSSIFSNDLATIAILILFVVLGGILSGFGSYIFYMLRTSGQTQ